MPDRVKLCEYCGRIWYEEDQDPQQYICPDDGTDLIDTKIVYTEEEFQEAIKAERKKCLQDFVKKLSTGYTIKECVEAIRAKDK